MSSLQTMTAPAVGHNRPPDPGIGPNSTAANTAARTSDAIVDNATNASDDFSRHDFTRAVNANANTEINTDIDNKSREQPALITDVATPKQNGSVDPMPRPQDLEVNKEENTIAVVEKRTEENQEKEGAVRSTLGNKHRQTSQFKCCVKRLTGLLEP